MSFNKYDFKVSDICWCDCHINRPHIVKIEMFPCCSLYKKTYLDQDGKLIVNKYIALKEDEQINKIV